MGIIQDIPSGQSLVINNDGGQLWHLTDVVSATGTITFNVLFDPMTNSTFSVKVDGVTYEPVTPWNTDGTPNELPVTTPDVEIEIEINNGEDYDPEVDYGWVEFFEYEYDEIFGDITIGNVSSEVYAGSATGDVKRISAAGVEEWSVDLGAQYIGYVHRVTGSRLCVIDLYDGMVWFLNAATGAIIDTLTVGPVDYDFYDAVFGSDNFLYMTWQLIDEESAAHYYIIKISPDAETVVAFSESAEIVAPADDGYFYLLQPGAYLRRYSPSGALADDFSEYITDGSAVAINAQADDLGNVYLSYLWFPSFSKKINSSGALLWGGGEWVAGVLSSDVLIGSGKILDASTGSTMFSFTENVTVDAWNIDSDGNLTVFDDNWESLTKYSPSGSVIWNVAFSTEAWAYSWLDNSDNSYIPFEDGSILKITSDGVDSAFYSGFADSIEVGYSEIGVGGIDPVLVDFEGIAPTVLEGATGATQAHVVNNSLASAAFTGIEPTIDYDQLTITPPAAVASFAGIETTQFVIQVVTNVPADVYFAGVEPTILADFILCAPAVASFAGVAPSAIDYYQATITPQAADVSASGVSPGVLLFNVPVILSGIAVFPVLANANYAGIVNYPQVLTAFEYFLQTMPANYPAVTLYQCYLTGSPDLMLPISSFQARLRNGEPTYLEVVVPNGPDYIDGIAARSAGDIVVEKGLQYPGGTSDFIEIVRVDFELAPYDFGPVNKSIRLSGHRTTTYSTPKTTALTSVSGESLQSDGKRRIRAAVDFLARPGDTVTWNGGDDSMVVGLITLTVSVTQQIMDITEA